jgi:hypothetical protein
MQPTQPFEEILTALAEQDDELDGLLAGLDEPGWARPSRCDGWSISDVVLHLAQTAEMTVASAERRFDTVSASFGNRVAPAGATVDDLARLAWRTIPYAFQQAGRPLSGPVAVTLTAPDGRTWEFAPGGSAATTVTGPALDRCLVAARRIRPSDTALRATGADADAVLDLVRTFA